MPIKRKLDTIKRWNPFYFSFYLFFAWVVMLASAHASNPGSEAPGRLVEANNVQIHIYCQGQGSPTILLEAGLGGNSLEWNPVQNRLLNHTRVCSYDRPGYGWSEISDTPRNARTISGELKALLDNAGEPGPFLLVGHSFGGHIVRLFANEFADSVSGIVLVDASHERLFEFLRGGSASSMLVTVKAPSSYNPSVPDNLPAELKPVFSRLSERPETKVTVQNETFYFRRSAAEVNWFPELPPVPVSIVSRGSTGASDDAKSNTVSQNWMNMQRDLHTRLSNSEHIIAANSGHYPHLDEPDLVSETIQTMLHQIREQ